MTDDAFTTLSVELAWPEGPEPSAQDMSAVLLSLQTAYEIIASESDVPPTLLRVSALMHPNMLLTITGLTAAVLALKGWLASNPAVIVSLVGLAGNIVSGRQKGAEKPGAPSQPSVVVIVQDRNASLIAEVESRLGSARLNDGVRKEVIAALSREIKPHVSDPPVHVRRVRILDKIPPDERIRQGYPDPAPPQVFKST